MEPTYETWLKEEREWIGAYCGRTLRNSLLKVIPMTLVLSALLFGGLACLNGGTQNLRMGMIGGLVFGAAICAFYLAILLLSLRPGRYVRKIERCVKDLSMTGMERERLGKEMLAALEQGDQVLSYQMVGPNSKGTPARLVVTPHYVLQEGSSPYAILVRLGDIAQVKTGSEKKVVVTRGAKSRTRHDFTLYTIGFYRRDRVERGVSENDLPDYAMGFFQKGLRDDAAGMVEKNGMQVMHPEI